MKWSLCVGKACIAEEADWQTVSAGVALSRERIQSILVENLVEPVRLGLHHHLVELAEAIGGHSGVVGVTPLLIGLHRNRVVLGIHMAEKSTTGSRRAPV